ncbi:phage tail protein [Pseudomonas sp. TE50-2]|uniref:phage tail-collar fiber domain-containing protein n=1 Tax=Pseudomonas sp. TE50-2 TaxID=3142707 RepID=UPI00346681E2
MATITLAGERLIAEKIANDDFLTISRFIYANVPGLDPAKPVDRNEAIPPAQQIVHRYEVPNSNRGFVNPNQVVYSSMLGSDIGDFDWNWLGLETTDGILFAAAYVPMQQKRRNIPPLQIGNNTTRNILVEFSGAQAVTGITIDASTWQYDSTVRLAGIDERERVSNRDIFGPACFFGTAMQLEKANDSGGYRAKGGLAYVEGIRIGGLGSGTTGVTISSLPATVWVDVAMERNGNDVYGKWTLVTAKERPNYWDAAGKFHYCVAIADVTSAGIVDRRTVEPIDGPLVRHFATRKSVTDLEDGTTSAGKARRLAEARQIALQGDVTGRVDFDGSSNVALQATLADIGVVPGAYSKVIINGKGQVVGNEPLKPADIPSLDWSKLTSGKPSTLQGYGITDALRTGYSNQIPRFYSDTPSTNYINAALEIREVGLVLNSKLTWEYAPRLGFHWGSQVAGDLAMNAQGVIAWNGLPLYHTGNLNPAAIVPAGTLIQTFSRTAPSGTLRCNGAAVSRTTYAALFAAIGIIYGVGDGATTFNLPDTRGLFTRDVDDGRGFDPGRAQGSVQNSQNLWHAHSASAAEAGWHYHPGSSIAAGGEHTHTAPRAMNNDVGNGAPNFTTANYANGVTAPTHAAGSHTHGLSMVGDGVHSHAITIAGDGGNESRPVNMALYSFIKY